MLAALMRAALLAVVDVVAVGTELGSHQPSQLGPFFSRESRTVASWLTAGTGDAAAVSPVEVAAAVAVVVVVEMVVVIACYCHGLQFRLRTAQQWGDVTVICVTFVVAAFGDVVNRIVLVLTVVSVLADVAVVLEVVVVVVVVVVGFIVRS